jgi:hypothetical protein
MENLPTKDYSPVFSFNQLCLPMDVGVPIPQDDSIRLPAFVLEQLDVKPLSLPGENRAKQRIVRGSRRTAAETNHKNRKLSADALKTPIITWDLFNNPVGY